MRSWTSGVVVVMWQSSCGLLDPVGQKRERDGLAVARLGLDLREVDGPAIEPGGCRS